MSDVLAADCAGLWRRTLLIEADGSRDTAAGVAWLQAGSAYVDSRGFGGELIQRGTVFSWRRDVELEPSGPVPDEGDMHWEGQTLVETGVHEDYVEHWVRDLLPTTPRGGLFLRAPDGDRAILVRVGPVFGWLGAGDVVIDTVGGPRWAALAIDLERKQIQANGVRWVVERSEGTVDL
ncbi:hypothetical protein H5U98_19945 [Mycolicibacterium boenickei]|uniref:Uncharacterized protein n=1 Tax=Mycolicibacterium boenickei TaxID=146017 RepID=A0AAX2ZRI5_9MYCO|nr:hypothetical protein [Mycolicibacterium boenickei]PEG60741.1 hypothetical protein CQY21_11875 [Mycolicibacterium boenickei]UNB97833.1 hypothetical protein H5U98_19945 [Mycolicibacterium boenickei]BBX93573.1 hypothetical protein MBOE_52220 [Mycolicibacterium boenickei]